MQLVNFKLKNILFFFPFILFTFKVFYRDVIVLVN